MNPKPNFLGKEKKQVREQLTKLVDEASQEIQKSFSDIGIGFPVAFTVPKNETYGDYATNLALTMAKVMKQPPMKIAESLVDQIPAGVSWLKKIEVVKPGFINFFLKNEAFQDLLPLIIDQKEGFGQILRAKGKKVQIEFVSANPTGPLHIGHGRGAALGAVLANLLRATGYEVTTEYYLNDLGTQMENLGRSIQARFKELRGEESLFPENGYKGEYIKEIAAEILKGQADRPADGSNLDLAFFSLYGRQAILKDIQKDLENFGIKFDHWFSEESLVRQGLVEELIRVMKSKGLFYEKDGALWFKSSDFGDEKDRVVVRANGALTYFASDMAYHLQKFSRGYDRLIDIWGADHHGYVPRLKAALQSLGLDPKALTVILVQLVTLIREGKLVAMSTRAGEFVTLKEVLDEVGKDAARFIFLTRRSDSPLDFDLDLAKKQSNENPVYYVQYAHARVCSVLSVARSQGFIIEDLDRQTVRLLTLPEERKLCKHLTEYPEEVYQAAAKLEPHRIPFYLGELAAQFHHYYNHHRILQEDHELSQARLILCLAIGTVIKNALNLLGVSAPQKMMRENET
ncbi:MAG: arginine--tRNA ligase [Deltaproteobacteria bacterium]|nr:arginine--tRNA ligase [Deltaproteobacteria bacterium]